MASWPLLRNDSGPRIAPDGERPLRTRRRGGGQDGWDGSGWGAVPDVSGGILSACGSRGSRGAGRALYRRYFASLQRIRRRDNGHFPLGALPAKTNGRPPSSPGVPNRQATSMSGLTPSNKGRRRAGLYGFVSNRIGQQRQAGPWSLPLSMRAAIHGRARGQRVFAMAGSGFPYLSCRRPQRREGTRVKQTEDRPSVWWMSCALQRPPGPG